MAEESVRLAERLELTKGKTAEVRVKLQEQTAAIKAKEAARRVMATNRLPRETFNRMVA